MDDYTLTTVFIPPSCDWYELSSVHGTLIHLVSWCTVKCRVGWMSLLSASDNLDLELAGTTLVLTNVHIHFYWMILDTFTLICVHCQPAFRISSQYGSPMILISGDIRFIPKFKGGHPDRGHWMRVEWVRIGDFRPINHRISETERDTTQRLLLINDH